MDNDLLQVSELGLPLATSGRTITAAAWPKALLRDLLETVLPALIIAVLLVVYVIQPTRVDGTSMEPTLHTEQRLVIEKLSYRLHPPAHGDIVVLKLPGLQERALIKRVVATGGDVVAVRDGLVYLNGAPLDEAYLTQITPGEVPSMVVPEGYVFVLGDNRGASNDSRTFGMVPADQIVGHAILSYWPLDSLGIVR